MIETVIQFETNIDDMDPRLWPHVIEKLLEAGAVDAWVTPIIMKKGRPAFTLGVLCNEEHADRVRTAIFAETTTLGVRQRCVERHVLDRARTSVEVGGQPIGVKVASSDGEPMNRSVEWDQVAAAAEALGLTAKEVLAAASAAAHEQVDQ